MSVETNFRFVVVPNLLPAILGMNDPCVRRRVYKYCSKKVIDDQETLRRSRA